MTVVAILVVAFVRDVPRRPVLSDETMPATTSTMPETTSTTSAPTTTEPSRPDRFRSSRGWSFQPEAGWRASTEDPGADLVIWVTPAGSLVSVQTVANEEGFVVTPRSVRDGLPDYLAEAFEMTGPVSTEDVEMGGHWAVRGFAEDEEEGERVVVVVGSPGRVTHIVALHGPADPVERDRADFDRAVEGFRYE